MSNAQLFRPSNLQRASGASCVALCALLLCVTARADTLSEVQALVDAGQFKAAETRIAQALAQPSNKDQAALGFERERMRRILLDFSLTAEDAQARLRRQIPDLSSTEFAAWDAAGLLEHMDIDGRRLYFNRSPSNLFRLSPAAVNRRSSSTPPWTDGPNETANAHHREVRDEAIKTGKPAVAPRRVQVTYSLIVNPDAVPNGETVRAWLPFPRAIPGQQENVRLVQSTPASNLIAPETALQRTVYLELPAQAGKPTRFSITYELTVFGQYHAIDASKVRAIARKPGRTPALAEDLAERPPHIVFTPAIREYSRKVVGAETNPYRIAQKLFAAVDRIPWGGAREYSTISNISDYALHSNHADCGQQTLLLMTLLRLNGIPTRWQSGWVFSDATIGDEKYDNMHDWAQLYLPPYGWVPMDVTFGVLKSGDPQVDWFYLGGLDSYRIAFNDDFSQPFVPAKQHYRSDTVDSQRGEVEWRGGNLYFDQWDYEFKASVLTTP